MRQQALIIETTKHQHERWISSRDLFLGAKLACCLLAGLTPSRHWSTLSRLMARIHVALRRENAQLFSTAAFHLACSPRSLFEKSIATDYLYNIEAIREGLPGGWNGRLDLVGREHLDSALQRSRGVVFWYGSFSGSTLQMPKALSSAGYSLTLLGSPTHPFSPTRIGELFLNMPRRRVENRYLDRRVFFTYGKSRSALEMLRHVLQQNGIVLIRAIGAGQKTLTFPFLGGAIELAVGAPRLAYESGAALLPVFTLPGKDTGYRIEVLQDLNHALPGSGDDAVRLMTERYVKLCEHAVREHPAHWEGWFHPATWHARLEPEARTPT